MRDVSPLGKPCTICRMPAKYGYSERAEELDRLTPMCRDCLVSRLSGDYDRFEGQAVVVQPAEGPPVYVYQPVAEWKAAFPDSKIADDVEHLLSDLAAQCQSCSGIAKYLWIGSSGLTGENFTDTLDRGISQTLLADNPDKLSLCSKCCVRKIEQDLRTKDIEYLEICAPKGNSRGFVIPMGY